MDDFLRGLLYKKWKLGPASFTFLDVLLAVCITGTGVMLRLSVINYTVTDLSKLLALLLDFVLALFGCMIVHTLTGSRLRSFLTYAILAIYPTMAANSALWRRNSVYYAVLFLLGLYFFLKRQKGISLLCMGAGAVLAVSRMRISVQSLTLGWPNIYEIIGKSMFVELYNQVAVLFLLGALLTAWYCFRQKRAVLTEALVLQLFLLLALLIPYIAPSMPAWAGYTADIGLLLYAMYRPGRFYMPMLHLIVSYSAYAMALNGETKLPMPLFAVILLILLVNVSVDIYREISRQTR